MGKVGKENDGSKWFRSEERDEPGSPRFGRTILFLNGSGFCIKEFISTLDTTHLVHTQGRINLSHHNNISCKSMTKPLKKNIKRGN